MTWTCWVLSGKETHIGETLKCSGKAGTGFDNQDLGLRFNILWFQDLGFICSFLSGISSVLPRGLGFIV